MLVLLVHSCVWLYVKRWYDKINVYSQHILFTGKKRDLVRHLTKCGLYSEHSLSLTCLLEVNRTLLVNILRPIKKTISKESALVQLFLFCNSLLGRAFGDNVKQSVFIVNAIGIINSVYYTEIFTWEIWHMK